MINVAINLIANAVSKCEFKTYVRGAEVKKTSIFYGIISLMSIRMQMNSCMN